MAEWNDLRTLTTEAAADLSLAQYHIVRYSAANKMNIGSTTIDDKLMGVLQTKPKLGEFGTIGYEGKTKLVAGGSITAGNLITVNGSGRATTVASGGYYIGRALDAAGADGDIITALIGTPPVYKAA